MNNKETKQEQSEFDIVVVGSNMIDLLSHIPRLPKIGETLVGDSFHLGFGGKGANQAVMAAKLGARVSIVTKIGDDVFGSMTYENFVQAGIKTDNIYVQKYTSSGVAPIFVDPNGDNMIVIIPGANLTLSPAEVEQAADKIRSAKLVVSQLEINEDAIIAGFSIAREANVITILNPAPAHLISTELLGLCDILIPNETEAEVLTGIKVMGIKGAEQAAIKLIDQGVNNLLITLGKNGAYLFTDNQQQHFPAIKVNAKDTTGAGDAFIGSLAFSLSQGNSLPEAIKFANFSAALSVTKIGTQTSFPTISEIADFQMSMS